MTEYLFFFSLASPLTVAMELGISDITDQCVYILAVGVWRWKAECEDWTNTTRTYRVSKPAGVQLQTQRASRLLPDPHRRAICRTRSHRDKRVYVNEKEFKLTDFKSLFFGVRRSVTSWRNIHPPLQRIDNYTTQEQRCFPWRIPQQKKTKEIFFAFFYETKMKKFSFKNLLGVFLF